MFELAGGLREQPLLARIATRVLGGKDEPAGAIAGVLGHLADLRDVPELGRLAELALTDMLCYLLAAADELLEPRGRCQLHSRTTAACASPYRGSEPPGLF
jgi:hypothetical protein